MINEINVEELKREDSLLKIIKGKVVYSTDEPIYNAIVTLSYNVIIPGYINEIPYTIGYTNTDKNGEFNFLLDISADISEEYILKVYKPLEKINS